MMGPALMLFASAADDSGGGEQVVYDAPSRLTTFEYQAGIKYGLQWKNGNDGVTVQVWRDGVLYATRPAGSTTYDVGVKAGDGAHTWKVRHALGNLVSPFSDEITTVDGVVGV